MSALKTQLDEALGYIKRKTDFTPEVAIVLGSGLGGFTSQIQSSVEINYADIPNFPVSTVIGHSGKLVLGMLNGRRVICMAGRFHYYEGYSMQEVTFPIRAMRQLGATSILISNAAGGLNPQYNVGDLMVIRDHINLVSDHPLRGKNNDELGPRFPDQHDVYDKQLIAQALDIADQHGTRCHSGVYVGVTGPTFETPAEYKYMHMIGGDAVGMSTVPEVMVANHMGMKIFGISVISDEGNPAVPVKVSHADVVRAAAAAEPRMTQIVHDLLPFA